MDILKHSGNIKLMARFYELKPTGSGNSRIVVLTKLNNCVCCDARDVRLIKLNKCAHKQFLECYFKERINIATAVVCHDCHGMLMRIDDFINQVERCITQRQPLLNPKPTLTTVSRPTVITIKPRNITENKDVMEARKQLIPPKTADSEEIKEIELKKEDNKDDKADLDMGLDKTVNLPPPFVINKNRPAENYTREVAKIIDDPLKVKPEKTLVQNPPSPIEPSPIKKRSSSQPVDDQLYGKVQMVILTIEELEKEREETRQSEKYRSSDVRCEDCLLTFLHPYNLVDHNMNKHDKSNGDFVCDVCRSVYKTKAALHNHQVLHWRRYQCVPCGKRFKGESVVCISHYNKAHGADGHAIDQVFECIKGCDFTTSDYLAYKRHRHIHDTKQSCDECGKMFARRNNLMNHKKNVHSSLVRIYKCKDCNKEFKSHGGLSAHWRGNHAPPDKQPPPHFCNTCGRQFKTKLTLFCHLKNNSKHVSDDGRKFICDYCGEKFVFKNRLKDHIEVKHLKTEYKCKDCDKVCPLESSLKRHVQAKHTNQEPKEKILCDLCGKGFKTSHILKSHMRTHTGERPFECSYCSATFGFSSALYTHKRFKHEHPKVKQ